MPAFDSALVRKLNRFLPLGRDELAAVAELESKRRPIAAGTELVHEQQVGHHAFVLEDGWACSYKLLCDGGRQVIDFPIPGDVIGLRSVLLRASDHSFAAVTDVIVAELSARQLVAAFEQQPRLGVAFLWASLARRGHGGRASGRHRPARCPDSHRAFSGRAWAAAKTHRARLENGYTCPFNQYVLADALGLTAIHLNRTLRQLRERKLMTFRDCEVTFHDLDRLRMLAGHHGGYLDQGSSAASGVALGSADPG